MAKKNLQVPAYFMGWLTQELGLGMGIGNVFYMAQAGTSMETMLKSNGVPDAAIYHTLATAYAATTGSQNDVVVVTPGLYTETAMTTWSNSMTHLVGLGGPNQHHIRQGGTDTGAVAIRNTATTGLDAILYVTGHHCQVHNIDMQNHYNASTNRADFKVGGRNIFVKNCSFRGGDEANQLNHDDAGTPVIFANVSGAGMSAIFRDCHFGNSSNDTTTAGFLMIFEGSAGNVTAYFTEFYNCIFDQRTETVTSAVAPIWLSGGGGNGPTQRYNYFKDCLFYHFDGTGAGNSPYVIVDDNGYNHANIMANCTAVGYTAWTNHATYTYAPENLSTTHMGLAVLQATS